MQKLLETFAGIMGLTKDESQVVLKVLAAHLALETILTLVVLLVTVALPIFTTRIVGDLFDRRAKARERAERIQDITLAAYHEIFTAWKAMIESLGQDLRVLEAIVARMEQDPNYLPLFTFHDGEPTVYENYVKKDIVIFPTPLIGKTIEFYQSLQFYLAYLREFRGDLVKTLSRERRIGLVKAAYSTGYDYVAVGCETLMVYEQWVVSCPNGSLSDLEWLATIPELQTAIDPNGTTRLAGRVKTYSNISKVFTNRALQATTTGLPRTTVTPGDGSEGGP